jgi:N-acetylglucosaminyl-diphospho-decaprenol L-rhamnosyltransferase
MPSTAVIIVNYRSARLVVDCLHSLAPEVRDNPGMRVVIVDNASGDDSVAVLRQAIREAGWTWADVVLLDRNGGFAFGNNAAVRRLLTDSEPPDFIWLLNPDTIVRPGAACPLIDLLTSHPNVGIVGGGLEDLDGTRQTSAFRFPTIPGELEITLRLGVVTRLLERFRIPVPPTGRAHRTDWVNGASMMVRRAVFETVGLMDEGYFLYFEETDFCRRARRAGWDVWHEPASRVVHLEGQTTGVTGANRTMKRRPGYWFDSRTRYFRKHLGWTAAFLADVVHVAGLFGWKVYSRVRGKPDPDPPHLLPDFATHAVRSWL